MFYFNRAGLEWYAIHLYIANNHDLMRVLIERCNESNNGSLTWEGVSTLVKEDELRRDTNITQREIDLEHGLKISKQAFSSMVLSYFKFYIDANDVFFFIIFIISKNKYVYEFTMFIL